MKHTPRLKKKETKETQIQSTRQVTTGNWIGESVAQSKTLEDQLPSEDEIEPQKMKDTD